MRNPNSQLNFFLDQVNHGSKKRWSKKSLFFQIHYNLVYSWPKFHQTRSIRSLLKFIGMSWRWVDVWDELPLSLIYHILLILILAIKMWFLTCNSQQDLTKIWQKSIKKFRVSLLIFGHFCVTLFAFSALRIFKVSDFRRQKIVVSDHHNAFGVPEDRYWSDRARRQHRQHQLGLQCTQYLLLSNGKGRCLLRFSSTRLIPNLYYRTTATGLLMHYWLPITNIDLFDSFDHISWSSQNVWPGSKFNFGFLRVLFPWNCEERRPPPTCVQATCRSSSS